MTGFAGDIFREELVMSGSNCYTAVCLRVDLSDIDSVVIPSILSYSLPTCRGSVQVKGGEDVDMSRCRDVEDVVDEKNDDDEE